MHKEYPVEWSCRQALEDLTPEERELLRQIYGDDLPCWVKLDITPKYKCNGIEFNINNTLGLSVYNYENKPYYVIDIDFDPNKEKYCPWCYNKIQDYDETGIDCGGSCPPCVEKPGEIWKCSKIPLVLILLFAILLASLIYGYKKYKYEFRIGVSVTTIALISSLVCRYFNVCYYKYLAFLYALGIVTVIFLIFNIHNLLKKLSILKKVEFKSKIHIIEIPKLGAKEKEGIVNNSIIEFNKLSKKIESYINKGKYGKAQQDYNAISEIYEYLVDKASSEQLKELYEILEELYYRLLTNNLKEKLNVEIKGYKLRKVPYKFKTKVPKIKCKKIKGEVVKDKRLDKVHEFLKDNKLEKAIKLYSDYYGFYLPIRERELNLEKIKPEKVKFGKLKKLSETKSKEELTAEEKKLNRLHELIKENKIGLPRHISHLKEMESEQKKPEFVSKFDSEFDELIELIRKGKYKDAERKYKKLFGN